MTDTERIATALLGWVKGDGPKYSFSRFCHLKGRPDDWVAAKEDGQVGGPALPMWPDFTTPNGCRLFEDALDHKTLYRSYLEKLYALVGNDVREEDEAGYWIIRPAELFRIVLAAPAERVAACIKVLDEAGL